MFNSILYYTIGGHVQYFAPRISCRVYSLFARFISAKTAKKWFAVWRECYLNDRRPTFLEAVKFNIADHTDYI